MADNTVILHDFAGEAAVVCSNNYDAAVVVPNDSDLAEPIRLVRRSLVRRKLGKRVIVLHPCGPGRNPSFELKKVATKSLKLDTSLLPACQFPPTLKDAIGTIHKPPGW